jgi:hypothetical protein
MALHRICYLPGTLSRAKPLPLSTHIVKRTLIPTLILSSAISLTSLAGSITQEPKPTTQHSRVVVIDGESKILLPDGRIIPFGPSVQCTDICLTDEIAVTASSSRRRWIVPVLIAGAIGAWAYGCGGDDLPPVQPETPGQPPVTPPATPIPEPVSAGLVLLGVVGYQIKRLLTARS